MPGCAAMVVGRDQACVAGSAAIAALSATLAACGEDDNESADASDESTESTAAGDCTPVADFSPVTDGTLTVDPAELTITATDQSKTYGDELTLGTILFVGRYAGP